MSATRYHTLAAVCTIRFLVLVLTARLEVSVRRGMRILCSACHGMYWKVQVGQAEICLDGW
jgi:hypothetical protein